MDIMFVIGFLVVGAGGIWFFNYYRQQKVKQVAEEMGLEFLPKVNLLYELDGCDLFINSGHNQKCINCFGGEADGIEFKVFEYQFTTGYGKRQQVHSQTVAYINVERMELPTFFAKPQSFMSKMFGGKPVSTIEIDPEFSKSYWVSTPDSVKTRGLFNQEIRRLISLHYWSVESNRGRLLIYREGKTVGHKELKNFLSNSIELMMTLESAKSIANPKEFPFPVGKLPLDNPQSVAELDSQQSSFPTTAAQREQTQTKRAMGVAENLT